MKLPLGNQTQGSLWQWPLLCPDRPHYHQPWGDGLLTSLPRSKEQSGCFGLKGSFGFSSESDPVLPCVIFLMFSIRFAISTFNTSGILSYTGVLTVQSRGWVSVSSEASSLPPIYTLPVAKTTPLNFTALLNSFSFSHIPAPATPTSLCDPNTHTHKCIYMHGYSTLSQIHTTVYVPFCKPVTLARGLSILHCSWETSFRVPSFLGTVS